MQTETDKVVFIRVGNPSRILPVEVQQETTNSIGSKFDSTKRGVPLMGLSELERRVILPNVIGVSYNDIEWNKKVTEFYCDLTIRPDPIEGVKLNIDTVKKDIMIDGKSISFDYPTSPLEYIMYKQCLVDNSVANNFKQAKEGTFLFYIDDEQAEKQREKNTQLSIQKLEREYINLCEINEKDEYINKSMIKLVIRLLGKNPLNMDYADMMLEIKDLRNRSIRELEGNVDLKNTEFFNIVKDPQLKDKAFVLSLVEYGILIKDGEYYIDAKNSERILGEGLEQSINFITNGVNQDIVLKYKTDLQSKIKKEETVE